MNTAKDAGKLPLAHPPELAVFSDMCSVEGQIGPHKKQCQFVAGRRRTTHSAAFQALVLSSPPLSVATWCFSRPGLYHKATSMPLDMYYYFLLCGC